MADETTTQTTTTTTDAGTADSSAAKTEGTVLTAKTGEETSGEKKTEGEVKTEGTKEGEKKTETTTSTAIDPAALKLPEGFKADEATMKAAIDIIADDKLSPQDRTQKLVDFHAAELKKASEASSKYWAEQQIKWQDQAKETYGPEPAKSPKIVAVAKLIDSLGEKPASELREALEMSGMGNHPSVIAAFVALADRMGEPKHLTGNPTSTPKDPATAFYPDMKQG
jgi:hypothetical protein